MKSEVSKKELENFMYNVVQLRKYYGISKKRMAELLGISIGSLNKIENGEFPPKLSVEVIFNIHNIFGIHPKIQLEDGLWIKKLIKRNDL